MALPSEEPIKNGYVNWSTMLSREFTKKIRMLNIIINIPIILKRLKYNDSPLKLNLIIVIRFLMGIFFDYFKGFYKLLSTKVEKHST